MAVIDLRADADGSKRFRGGSTQRIVDPEETLRRIVPLAAQMGITRVAMLTGLDTIGIPVAAAFRPNSRSVAVHQGKGMTAAAAKASAIMEAAETFHAERMRQPLRLASYEELIAENAATDPQQLPRARSAPEPDRCFWVEGQEVISGIPMWVPFELVSADYRRVQPADLGLFQATTNGLGSGNCRLEAMLHGLYEVVERDAIALWRAVPTAQAQRAVDLDTVDGSACKNLLERFHGAGVPVRVWDVTSDVGLPTFVCLAMASDTTQGVEPELGSGCHADRDVALARALTEAAQARVTRISGARDDFVPNSYNAADRRRRLEAARLLFEGSAVRDFHLAPNVAGETLQSDLDAALLGLQRAGMSQAVWVDLSQDELGIPAGRIVVPRLEGPWTPQTGDYRAGERARNAASGHQ